MNTISIEEHPNDDVLTAYALGNSDAAVEEHIASCPSCARQIKEIREIKSALTAMPDEDVPSRLLSKVYKQLGSRRPGLNEWFSLSSSRILRNTFLLIGGLCAAVIALYIFFVFVL
jgi:anti-sigma factor RsiW